MIFFKTHNANQLKCCCNGLTSIPPAPRIDPAASIVVQFPPCFQMFLLHVFFFLLLLSDQMKLAQLDFAVRRRWIYDVSSGVLDVKYVCTVMLLASFCTSWEGTVGDRGNVLLKEQEVQLESFVLKQQPPLTPALDDDEPSVGISF